MRLWNKLLNKRIYLDYASLTPVDPRVLRAMNACHASVLGKVAWGNPSSLHREGVEASKILQDARMTVAKVLHAHADEIIFTGSGTEANNLAIMGVVNAEIESGTPMSEIHIVTSEIEHASVLECFKILAKKGVQVDFIQVTKNGVIDLVDFEKKVRPETLLVSIQYVNNEIGTVQPIVEIAKILRRLRNRMQKDSARNPLLHVDASQAAFCYELNMEKMGIDLMTLDAHKIYGPRGVGMLYVRRATSLASIIYGGGQEKGLRSGTENVPGIVGFSAALQYIDEEREVECARLSNLRIMTIGLLKNLPLPFTPETKVIIHGEGTEVSPHILNFELPGFDAEALMIRLDAKGIACSTKSSCLREASESYVLKAIGADSRSSLRISFGKDTTSAHIIKFVEALREVLPFAKLESHAKPLE